MEDLCELTSNTGVPEPVGVRVLKRPVSGTEWTLHDFSIQTPTVPNHDVRPPRCQDPRVLVGTGVPRWTVTGSSLRDTTGGEVSRRRVTGSPPRDVFEVRVPTSEEPGTPKDLFCDELL